MQRTLIIIPSFNERENIVALVRSILTLHPEADVLVVDDSSPDGTTELLRSVQLDLPHLHLLVRSGKGGRGSAVLEGFTWGLQKDYEVFFEMDADFSHRPEEIATFLERICGAGCVVGSRYLPESRIEEWGWKRTFFSRFANLYARLILRIPLTDYTNGFRCYTRRAIMSLDFDAIDARGYVVLSEVAWQLHRNGIRFVEVPVIFVNRRRGLSNLTSKEIREAFLSVLRIRWPRIAMHVEQGLKFGLVGFAGATLDFLLLNLFTWGFALDPRVANVFSTFIVSVLMFVLNKRFTFRGRQGDTRAQAARFTLVYALAYVLNVGFTALFITLGMRLLQVPPTPVLSNLSKALAIGVVMCWNYFLLHTFVFAEGRKGE